MCQQSRSIKRWRALVFPGGRFYRKPDLPFGPDAHLGKILRELGVSWEQREQVRILLTAQRECAQEPLENLLAANQELINGAYAQCREIMQAVRNSELTRASAGAVASDQWQHAASQCRQSRQLALFAGVLRLPHDFV